MKAETELDHSLQATNTHCLFLRPPRNVNGDVLATFRVVFRVSRIQQYSDSFVQDLLRAGLSSAMHGKPLEVPQFGEVNSIILLGRDTVVSSLLESSNVLAFV